MKLPRNSPDVKNISEENYVLVKARGNLCWCSWDVILFRLFPLCTSEQLERQKRKEEKGKKHTHMHTTSLWIFFHSAAFFASISPPSVCLAPSSPLCLLSVMVLYHAAAPWGKEQWFLHIQGHSKGTNMISPWTEPGSVVRFLNPAPSQPGMPWVPSLVNAAAG